MTLIEDLLDLQIPNEVWISPNAQQVLYSTTFSWGHKTGEHDCSTLWLAETGKPKSARQLTSGLANDRSPRWNPDGKSIAFISDRAKPGESCAIYMLPIGEGGEAYPVTPVENERDISNLRWSPKGGSIAFSSADEESAEKKAKVKDKDDPHVWGEDWAFDRLRLLHVATRKVTTLVNRNAHVVDVAWNGDGTKIAFAEAKTPDIESPYVYGATISIVNVFSLEIQRICQFPCETGGLTWAGNLVHFIGGVNPENLVTAQMVYAVDLSHESPSYQRHAHGEEDCAIQIGKASNDVLVEVEHGMEGQIRMLKGKTLFSKKKGIEAWDAAFTTDSDEIILAIAQGDTNSSPEVYTTTASGGAMVQLSSHGETFNRQFGTPNFISCPAVSLHGEPSDRLDGVYIVPSSAHSSSEGKPETPLPTVVWIHGGPYSSSSDCFNPTYHNWSPVLLDAGYGVLLVNYRGGSGRGEKFAAYARASCGIYDVSDVITLTQCAIEQGFADKDRLVVGGWSQGGFLSFVCSTRNGLHEHGWKFKAAIPGAGVSDGDTMCMTSDLGFQQDMSKEPPWKSDKKDISGRTGSAIWEFKAAVEKGGVIPPMLILHGENDERVPIEQARGFRRALESAGLPFELVTYPREPHAFKERKHIVDMAGRMLRFVDTHIGGKSS